MRVPVDKYESVEIDGEEYAIETDDWKRYKEKSLLGFRIKNAKIPNYAHRLSFDDIHGMEDTVDKLRLYVEKFDSRFKDIHLYFWSSKNGTQKTTTAAILAKELLARGKSVAFILMNDLSKFLSGSVFEDIDNPDVQRYLNVDFLVVDDSFDAKKTTLFKSGYQIPFLDTFFRMRLENNNKATCFTSNVSVDDISEDTFGVSLVRLIQRSILDPFEFTVPYARRNDFDPKEMWERK